MHQHAKKTVYLTMVAHQKGDCFSMKNKFYKVLVAALLLLVLIPTALAAEEAPPTNQLASDLTSSYGEWRDLSRSDEFKITYTDYSIYAC